MSQIFFFYQMAMIFRSFFLFYVNCFHYAKFNYLQKSLQLTHGDDMDSYMYLDDIEIGQPCNISDADSTEPGNIRSTCHASVYSNGNNDDIIQKKRSVTGDIEGI